MVIEQVKVLPGCKRRLGLRHALHVRAAEYWMALGNLEEAARELESIQWSRRKHPRVREIQNQIEAQTKMVKMVIRDDCILEPYWDQEQPPAGKL